MSAFFLHVGFDNVVAAARVVAIVGPASAPVKRMVAEAATRNMVIDMTSGRKTKAVLVLDSGQIVLSALHPATISGRMDGQPARAGGGALRRDAVDDE